MVLLTVSIVTYIPERAILEMTLASLYQSLQCMQSSEYRIFIIDNSASSNSPEWLIQWCNKVDAELLHGRGNIGYGSGHNLVVQGSGKYHLILNPDVELWPDTLSNALSFMDDHTDCGLITPASIGIDGNKEYLCKRYPDLFTLLLRGFAPRWLRHWFSRRIARYEMHDVINDHSVHWDPLIVSGCFMFFRGDVLRQLEGFSAAYFLYFEDFDISLRASKLARIAYVPGVKIRHHGGNAAQKGWQHIRMFSQSLGVFFNTYGWKWF